VEERECLCVFVCVGRVCLCMRGSVGVYERVFVHKNKKFCLLSCDYHEQTHTDSPRVSQRRSQNPPQTSDRCVCVCVCVYECV
jgi:hypothetical protein